MARTAEIKKLAEERKKLVMQARKIIDKASAEGRGMSSEEKDSWERFMRDVDALKERMDELARQDDAEKEEDTDTDTDTDAREDEEDTDEEDTEAEDAGRSATRVKGKKRIKKLISERRSAGRITDPNPVNDVAQGRAHILNAPKRANETLEQFKTRQRRNSQGYIDAFNDYFLNGPQALLNPIHQRSVQADADIQGGYLVMPQIYVAELIKFMDNDIFVRALATKKTSAGAQSLGAPSLDTDISDAAWTSERSQLVRPNRLEPPVLFPRRRGPT